MNEQIVIMIGAALLLGISWFGLLVTRNLIKIILVLQVMVKAALLMLAAAAVSTGQGALVQSLILTVIVADTIVAVIGLALAVRVREETGSLDVALLSRLRG